MKRFIASLIFLAATAAQAHVLLTTPYVQSGPGAIIAINDPHLTCVRYDWIWGGVGQPNIMQITYAFGTATYSGGLDNGWTTDPNAPLLINSLNMTTGQWNMMLQGPGINAGVGSGVLTGAQLTGALAAFTGPQIPLRDFADYFLTLTGSGFLPVALGTQPDLWQLGDM